ncbi:MAG: hypothetical protein ABIJ97_05170 [Bacteroidota bacterium]
MPKFTPNCSHTSACLSDKSPDAYGGKASIKITGLNGHLKTTIPVIMEAFGTKKTLINTTGWAKGTYVCNLFFDGKLVKSEKMVLK